jgi:hypothetical protein
MKHADCVDPGEEEPEPGAPRLTVPKVSSRKRSPPETMSPGGYALRPLISGTPTYDSRSLA